MSYSPRKYFAGANSPYGFQGYFESIIPPAEASHIYCIKGGPGVGKSTFMKRAGGILESAGHRVSYFYCPSDPNSLDGVLDEDTKTAWVDGTAPHITDPVYPGATASILDFGSFLDFKILKERREEIIELTDRVSRRFSDAKASLKPAGTIYENVKKIYRKSEDERAGERLYDSLSKSLFSGKTGNSDKIRRLFLSAITPDGLVCLADKTLSEYELTILDSFSGDLSSRLTERLLAEASERGIYAEAFYCPLSPRDKIDHIVFPELNRAVTVSNSYHPSGNEGKRADVSRCYYEGIDKGAISRAMETADVLIAKAVAKLAGARALHSELEKIYASAMDYAAMNDYALKTVNI